MDEDVMKRFPQEWCGLFKCFLDSKENAEVWYLNATQSQYGQRPAWHTILESLVRMDPCIMGNQLVFKPRLLLLPQLLQESFLIFLIEESYMVPDAHIKTFVLNTVKHTNRDKSCKIYELLTALYKQTKFGTTVFEDLDTQGCTRDSVIQSDVQSKQAPSDGTNDKAKAETVSPTHVIILEDEEITEPVKKRQKIEVQTNFEIYDGMEIEEVHISETNTAISKDEITAHVLDGKREIVDNIKEFWHNRVQDTASLEELDKMITFSVKEMDAFCKHVDFTNMSDGSIERVCRDISNMSNSLSYNCVVCLLNFSLCDRIKHLSQNASRKLSGAITLIAEKFPKQLIESVLVPCILESVILPPQTELLYKVIKESLNNSTRSYLLQKLVATDVDVNECKLAVLQCVLENACDLTDESFTRLLDVLYPASLSLGKNLKFGKLLLCLINKHGKYLTLQNKPNFERILAHHSTFLKKTILNALGKLKL